MQKSCDAVLLTVRVSGSQRYPESAGFVGHFQKETSRKMSSPSRKRKASLDFVPNPFVKKRNLQWSISPPPFKNADHGRGEAEGPEASVDPPIQHAEARTRTGEYPKDCHQHKVARELEEAKTQKPQVGLSASAAIENNTVKITDHLAWFSSLLTKATLQPFPAGQPRLTILTYQSLYNDSFQSSAGAHFVITQHDHPVAGPHYDLRLQINRDSSCSWAIMYGCVYLTTSCLVQHLIHHKIS